MNVHDGYKKLNLTNQRILLAGGGDIDIDIQHFVGKINLTSQTDISNAQAKLLNDGEYVIYVIGDSQGKLPSACPAISIPAACVKQLTATVVNNSTLNSLIPVSEFSSMGANVEDLVIIARISTTIGELKTKYPIITGNDSTQISIYTYKIIPINDAKATNFSENGYSVPEGVIGLESPWDKTQINKIPGIETSLANKLTVYTNSINAGNSDDIWPIGLFTNVTSGRTNEASGNWFMLNAGGWGECAQLAVDKGNGALYSRIVTQNWGRVLRDTDNLGSLDYGYTVEQNSTGSQNFAHTLNIRNRNRTNGLTTIFSVGGPDDYLGVGYFGFVYKGQSVAENFATIGIYNQDYIINATAAGNVGIGTTTPAYKLHVNGDIALGERLYLSDMSGVPRQALDYEDEDLWLGWGTTSQKFSNTNIIGNGITMLVPTSDATVSHFRGEAAIDILPNGNVGMGIAATEKLHVNGNVLAAAYKTGNCYVQSDASTGNTLTAYGTTVNVNAGTSSVAGTVNITAANTNEPGGIINLDAGSVNVKGYTINIGNSPSTTSIGINAAGYIGGSSYQASFSHWQYTLTSNNIALNGIVTIYNEPVVTHKAAGTNNLTGYSGSFFFSGNTTLASGEDYVGLQAGDSVDKWQLVAYSSSLRWRKNDSGGTNTSFGAFKTIVDSSNVGSYAVTKTFTGITTDNSSSANPTTNMGDSDLCIMTNYASNSYWTNMPTFATDYYGGVMQFKGANDSLYFQLAWNAKHQETTSPTGQLWFRARADQGFKNDWKRVVFADELNNYITTTNITNYIPPSTTEAVYPASSTSYTIQPGKEYFLQNISSNTTITLATPTNVTTQVNEYKFNFTVTGTSRTITLDKQSSSGSFKYETPWPNPFPRYRHYEVSVLYNNLDQYYYVIYSFWQ